MNPWIMRALDLAVALVAGAGLVLIWGVASERLVEIFNRAMDSIAGI